MGMSAPRSCCARRAAARAAGDRRGTAHCGGDGHQRHRRRRVRQRRRPRHADLQRHRQRSRAEDLGRARSRRALGRSPSTAAFARVERSLAASAAPRLRLPRCSRQAWHVPATHPAQFGDGARRPRRAVGGAGARDRRGDRDSAPASSRCARGLASRLRRSTPRTSVARCRRSPCLRW